ncbi:MAG: winged helix-turn-helix domain-containing protein [Pseudomonadota bacterium]
MRLSPKAMGVLSALAEAEGGVVSRAALLDRVWPNVTVGEEVLTQAVREVRRALGDSPQAPRFVETVHRAGYRLLVPVEPLGGPAAAPAPVGAVQGPEAAAPARPSVAVLPFLALSHGADEALITEGVCRDVTIALARTRWLFVSARASAAALAARTRDLGEIARRLGVRYVLDGAVMASDGRVRLSASLADAEEGGEVWGERFDRPMDGLFELMDELADHVAGSVEIEIESRERRRALLRPLASLDAWGAYHRASHHAIGATRDELDVALRLMTQAHELDPGASRILAGLATLRARRSLLLGDAARQDEIARATDLARRSVAADPRDPQACMALGRAFTLVGEQTEARARMAEALRLNPSFAHGHFYLGYALMFLGEHAEGVARVEAAQRLSPYDPMTFAFMSLRAQLLSLSGATEEGAVWAERALAQPHAHFQNEIIAAWCNALAGRDAAAASHAEAARRLRPNFTRADYFDAFRFTGDDRERIKSALASAGF